MNIEKDIWSYGQLPQERQQEIELFVREHKEFAEVLEQVKMLYKILPQTNVFTAEPVEDTAISYYIANQFMGQVHDMPGVLRVGYDTMSARINNDPILQERYATLQERIEHIVDHSDPLQQFQELTGHRLEPRPEPVGAYAEDRKAHRSSRLKLSGRRRPGTIKSGLVLVVLLIGAWVFYGNRTSRLAYTDEALLSIKNADVNYRSDDPSRGSASPDQQFIYGQIALKEGQRRWLGVYYTFDPKQLEQAKLHFNNVLASTDLALIGQSTFFLGKIALANGELVKARSFLTQVVQGQGLFSKEASVLLERLPDLPN